MANNNSISRNTDDFCKSNNKEVRSKKKESGQAAGLLAKTSSSSASPPQLLPSAKEKTCGEVRKEILVARPEIQISNISYMRLSLLTPKADDNDGQTYTRLAANMDVSFNNNTKFDKFKWRLTNKRSEFYANIPKGWENDFAYGSAWELYNKLPYTKWIGKACYRLEKRAGAQKLKLAPFTAIVFWATDDRMNYRLWVENAEVEGYFIEQEVSKFMGHSTPIKNFTASEMQVIRL